MLNVNNGQLLFTINVKELFKATCRTLLGSTADLAQTKAFVTLELGLFISCTAVSKSVNITTLYQNFLSQIDFKSGEYISRDNGASWRQFSLASNKLWPLATFKTNGIKKNYYWNLDLLRESSSKKNFTLHVYEKSEANNTYMIQQSIDLPGSCR